MRPPTLTEFLDIVRKVTPPDYHEPFFNDPGGAISLYRQFAQQMAYATTRINRSSSRQYFQAPVGEESAGFATRATMTAILRRSDNLDQLVVIDAGTLEIDGPRGRVYTNTNAVTWYPSDPISSRAIALDANFIGEPGNAEWLGFGGKLLVLQPESVTRLPDGSLDLNSGVLDTRQLDLANQSDQRSGVGATLTQAFGVLSEITDSGKAPVFRPGDVGLYLRINSASNLANVGRILRVVGYSRATVDDPVGSNIFPRTVIVDDGPAPNLLVSAQQEDGGLFTNFTIQSQTETPNDVDLLPLNPGVNDAFYFGGQEPFGTLTIGITTRLIGVVDIVWEYFDGAWQTLPFIEDNTLGFTVEGDNDVLFAIPGAWATTTINGLLAFYVRARVTAPGVQNQQPMAGLITYAIPAQLQPEPNPGELGWTIMDWADLGVVITEQTAPEGGRDADLDMLIRERGVVQREGETEDQLRRRGQRLPDVATPRMIENEVNRILEPFGLGALICDPANGGYTGLFWDVPADLAPTIVAAWDLYGDGDPFPLNKSFLPLDFTDSHLCFYIKVPPSGLGEFGAAWDDGPPSFFAAQFGTFLGSAWDYAFTDGFPWLSGQILLGVYDLVKQIKAAGTCFHIIEGEVPVCP